MNRSKEKLYTRRVIMSVISFSFIMAAFATLLIKFNYDPHFNQDPTVYQFDFMPTDYEPETGNILT